MSTRNAEPTARRRRKKRQPHQPAALAVVAPTLKRPHLAPLFQVAAVLVAALALGALAWDIIAPPARGGTPASQQGQGIGFIIGAALRTILLVVLAAFLRAKARSLADPNAVNPRTELREIAAALSGHVVAETAGAETAGAEGTYSDCTDEELVDVYRSIRREAVPSRFDELVCEIRRRTSA